MTDRLGKRPIRCREWYGLGRCTLAADHEGDHHLTLTPAECAYLGALGTGWTADRPLTTPGSDR